MANRWSVFTKPWPQLPAAQLGAKVAEFGFGAIELPVRQGFLVNPENVERDLPAFVGALADHGIVVQSVAGTTDEPTFAACAAENVPFIRVMVPVGPAGYLAAEDDARRWLDRSVPLAQRYGVGIGIQLHSGNFISTATGLRSLTDSYPAQCVGAVWDAAHDALVGQPPEHSLEVLGPRLMQVNLKNAYYRRRTGPELPAEWAVYYTSGAQGLADWPRVMAYLAGRGYSGPVCLNAEYTAEDRVDELVAADLRYAKSLN